MSQRLRTLLLLVLFTFMTSVGLFGLLRPTATKAAAGINNKLNFEGRLLDSTGAVVPDGSYNMRFKIYQDGDGTVAGDTSGAPAGTLLWTEEDINQSGYGVAVTNGYFSVMLGASSTLNGVNFNSDTLWLSMDVGTGAGATSATCTLFSSCSPNGEMLPMRRLASDPYALDTSQLQGISASAFGQLATNNTFTGTQLFRNTSGTAFMIQNAAGTLTAFSANTSTGQITLSSALQSTSGNNLVLDSGTSGAILIGNGSSTGGSTITIGKTTLGVTIPASSSLTLGTAGPSGQTGAIIFKNSTNANTLTLKSGITSSSYGLVLPTTDGSSGQCLQTGGGSLGALSFGGCINGGLGPLSVTLNNLSSVAIEQITSTSALNPGSGQAGSIDFGSGGFPFRDLYISGSSGTPTSNNYKLTSVSGGSTHGTEIFQLPNISGTSTLCAITGTAQSCPTNLQTAYTNSTGGSTAEIVLDATRGGLDIQDASTSVAGNLLNVETTGGSPTSLFSVSNGVTNSGVTVQSSSASLQALRVLNNAGSPASILTADTANNRIGVDVSYSAMGTMGALTPTLMSGGSLIVAANYYYKVTALDSAGGETAASAEPAVMTPTSGNQTVRLTWTAVTGAFAYRIYRGTTSGGEAGYLSSGGVTISGSTVTFLDAGSLTPGTTTTPPTTNTAYISSNVPNSANGLQGLQLSVGGNGTPTGQLYVSGSIAPSAIGSIALTTIGTPTTFVMSGRYGFMSGFGSPNVIDFSNPASPSLVYGIYGYTSETSSYISGRYYYYTSGSVIYSNEISNPTLPSAGGSIAGLSPSPTGTTQALAVSGRYGYVIEGSVAGTTDIQAIDVSNVSGYVALGQTATANIPTAIAVSGRYAYVLNAGSGAGSNTIQPFDVLNPSSITSYTGVSTGASYAPQGIAISGRYAYVVSSTGSATAGQLEIFDLSNPQVPVIVGTVALNAAPTAIAASGRYVYVGTSGTVNTSLQTVDVSNPTTPALVGSTSLSARAYTVTVNGRYAYVLVGSSTVQVFDLGGTYTQSLEVGSTEVGNLVVENNESINGNSSITGSLTVGQSLHVQGNLSVSGTLTPPSASTDPSPPTCSVSTIPGAIYYNTTVNTLRTCEYNATSGTSAWNDITTAQDLGILAYGVMPDSGAFPGDIASINTGSVSGPCKVSWATTASVAVSACTVYSGGRKLNIPATTITVSGVASTAEWSHVYIQTSTQTAVLSAYNTAEFTASVAPFSLFSITAPIVNLADIKTSNAATPVITNIYDTRVFTTDTKTFSTFDGNSTNSSTFNQTGTITGSGLSWSVVQSSSPGLVNSATYVTAANFRGVVVASTGNNATTSINVILVTGGSSFIKSTGTSAVNNTVIPTTTAGYVGTGTNASTYGKLGVSQLTIATSCSTASGALTSCQGSQLVDLDIL